MSNKKAFCNECREEVELKSTVVRNHVKSNKRRLGKDRLARKEATEWDIATAFKSAQQEEHLRGETLSEEQHVYRVRAVRVFLRTATPLNKLNHFRGLLEENSLRLTDRRQWLILYHVSLHKNRNLLRRNSREIPFCYI